MASLIDTSRFPVGRGINYRGKKEARAVEALGAAAAAFVNSYRWTPPIEKLVLAFGVGPILGLYLMRFEPGGRPEDRERWVVVGDLPSMHFETDDAPTPSDALRLYCAIAQDWADNVLAGRDLSESYPIDVAPTSEHANMLLSRIEFIRQKLVPRAH